MNQLQAALIRKARIMFNREQSIPVDLRINLSLAGIGPDELEERFNERNDDFRRK